MKILQFISLSTNRVSLMYRSISKTDLVRKHTGLISHLEVDLYSTSGYFSKPIFGLYNNVKVD